VGLLTRRPHRAVALILALVTPISARAQEVNEYEVKSAFLYNFTRFVDWPGSSGGGPFCIGIVGADPFRGALGNVVKGRSVAGRVIAIKHFKPGDDLSGCEVVFVSATDPRKISAILARLKGEAVLTVGESRGFCSSGGMIGFAMQDNKVKLEINLKAAQRSRLQISSKLLSLASLVQETSL
jgi:YfiR/HmsC-like